MHVYSDEQIQQRIDECKASKGGNGTLDLSYLPVTDQDCKALSEDRELKNLVTLDLGGTKIRDAGVVALASPLCELENLTTLYLGETHIADHGVRALAGEQCRLKNLTTLYLWGTQVSDAGAAALASPLCTLENLVTLHLGYTLVSDIGVNALAENPSRFQFLKTLILRGCKIVGAESVVRLIERLSPAVASVKPRGRLMRLDLENNALHWPKSGEISKETLTQTNPVNLYKLLMASRRGAVISHCRATMAGLAFSGKTRLIRWLTDDRHKKKHISQDDRTIGAEPHEIKFDMRQFGYDETGDVSLTIIDIGGQQEQFQSLKELVYRTSGRSIYILCLRADKEFHPRNGNRADYYLDMLETLVKSHDDKLPVLIVVTHGELIGKDRKLEKLSISEDGQLIVALPRTEKLGQEQRGQKPALVGANTEKKRYLHYEKLKLVLVDPYQGHIGRDIRDVQEQIAAFLAKLREIRAVIPDGVKEIRAALEKKFKPKEHDAVNPLELTFAVQMLSVAQYRKLCAQAGFPDKDLHGDYARILASLGTIIAPGVEETAGTNPKTLEQAVTKIFNPLYINAYIYSLLMDEGLREQKGFMSNDLFEQKTSKLTKLQRNQLKELLTKYLVAFAWHLGDQEGLLIPDLLPERTVLTDWEGRRCSTTGKFQRFLPERQFFQFLAEPEIHAMIEPLLLTAKEKQQVKPPIGVFRNEVMLRQHGRRSGCSHIYEALIRYDVVEREIKITVHGVNGGGDADEAERFRDYLRDRLTAASDSVLWSPHAMGAQTKKKRGPPLIPRTKKDYNILNRWKLERETSPHLTREEFLKMKGNEDIEMTGEDLKKLIGRMSKDKQLNKRDDDEQPN